MEEEFDVYPSDIESGDSENIENKLRKVLNKRSLCNLAKECHISPPPSEEQARLIERIIPIIKQLCGTNALYKSTKDKFNSDKELK